jgi:hypothetical protein
MKTLTKAEIHAAAALATAARNHDIVQSYILDLVKRLSDTQRALVAITHNQANDLDQAGRAAIEAAMESYSPYLHREAA